MRKNQAWQDYETICDLCDLAYKLAVAEQTKCEHPEVYFNHYYYTRNNGYGSTYRATLNQYTCTSCGLRERTGYSTISGTKFFKNSKIVLVDDKEQEWIGTVKGTQASYCDD